MAEKNPTSPEPEPEETVAENTGDGPSSNAATEPAVDPREDESGDGPSSAETCGQFPAREVYATFEGDDVPPDFANPEGGEDGGGGEGGDGPHIDALDPATTVAGGAALTLTVTGSGFESDASIELDGIGIATTFASASSVTGDYTPPAEAAAQMVTVRNMTTTAESNSVELTVTAAGE